MTDAVRNARSLRLSSLATIAVAALAACPSAPRPDRTAPDGLGPGEAPPGDRPVERAGLDPRPEPGLEARPARVFPAQVAGPEGEGFYSSSPAELRAEVDRHLGAARPASALAGRDLVGLLVPHAGYRYSGPVAGEAYRQLRGRRYSTVVVMALSHRRRAARPALLDHDAYETPLGRVPIDRELVRALAAAAPDVLAVDEPVFRGEHSLEVQLPFLQRALEGEFSIVPVVLASGDETHAQALAQVLFEQLGRRSDVLFVASSDLSHFYPYDEAVRLDRRTLDLVTALDVEGYRRRGPEPRQAPCGYHPVLALVELVARYDAGARRATLLDYRNSGDTAGDRSRVVGYGAVAFSLAPGARPEQGPPAEPVSQADRRALMDLARRAVRAAVEGRSPGPPPPSAGILAEPGAAFVTLRCETDGSGRCVGPGEGLRGCIGHVVARVPLHRCVTEVARAAAVEDTRFPTLTPAELAHLSYEISLLTPPEPLADPAEVVVGRDGLVMRRGGSSGLLLPQVPVEQGWDRLEFLARTCRKAHLEPTCWQDPATRIERFGAIVWGEDLVIENRRAER